MHDEVYDCPFCGEEIILSFDHCDHHWWLDDVSRSPNCCGREIDVDSPLMQQVYTVGPDKSRLPKAA